jgi:hypothetical protein
MSQAYEYVSHWTCESCESEEQMTLAQLKKHCIEIHNTDISGKEGTKTLAMHARKTNGSIFVHRFQVCGLSFLHHSESTRIK